MKKGILLLLLAIIILATGGYAQRRKILFIPLDDRPPCLQFTEKMGRIGLTELISPPREMLGKFTRPGDSDKIIEWISKHDLKTYDAAIISLDMLAYGGLVASRVYRTDLLTSLNRIKIINEIKNTMPTLPLFGQSVIMRLAPTSDGKNEPFREKLARWADISPYPENLAETKSLEAEIPVVALKEYKQARERNLAVNQAAIELVNSSVLDYLILSQDDAKPRGIHVTERESLISDVLRKNLTTKIIVQPGTDEISMLLLARALNRANEFLPMVCVKYSSEKAASTAMPFEDRPLRSTVSFSISAAGALETFNENEADLLFYVFTSRFDQGAAASFVSEIINQMANGKRVMIADIDPKGNAQGGDPAFTNGMLTAGLFPNLYSYASWNTAGNTIGTALPQGLIFHLAKEKLTAKSDLGLKILSAQNWFTFHRLLDDYGFHTVVRPKANEYMKQSGRSGFQRSDDIVTQLEKYSTDFLKPMFRKFSKLFSEWNGKSKQQGYTCVPTNMSLSLPWNRTFEAEINFDMICQKQ